MWNFYAYTHMDQENYLEAIESYQMVLEQPDLPLGLETGTLYTLVQLYMQQELYPEQYTFP